MSTMSSSEEDSDSGEVKPVRVTHVNLYRLDREKFETDSFDDIVKSHAQTVVKKHIHGKKEIICDQSSQIHKGIKIIFVVEQKVQTQTQVEANLEKTKNAFSVWYFEGKDGNIYVAGEGRSFHYIKDLADHKFPEMVFDRHLDEDVFEVQGQRLLGRVALYTERYRQEHNIIDNLWHYLHSLITKLKVPIRSDSELGKLLLPHIKKVFVSINFQNNSVQIKKALDEDDLVQVLDVLIRSFEKPSPDRCTLLRLVSPVRDDPTRQKLNKQLNEFLEKAGTCAGSSVSAGTRVELAALHANEDEWNSASEIVVKLPNVQEESYAFSPKHVCEAIEKASVPSDDIRVSYRREDNIEVISGREYIQRKHKELPATVRVLEKPNQKSTKITHERLTKPWSNLFDTLYQNFKKHCKQFDFLSYLNKVVIGYGGKKQRDFSSLLECRMHFPLENMSYMYFHGEWLCFHPRFHSLLEVHFLELMRTRTIESNLILPIPWPKAGFSPEQEVQFCKFFAAWLGRNKVSNEAQEDLETNTLCKELRKSLCSSVMIEPQYNELYLFVDQLMGAKGRGFLVGDGVTVKGRMELFDLMYFDECNVFFIHVKRGFSPKYMREVVDQVRHSAEYMQCLLLKGREDLEKEMRTFLKSLWFCEKGGDKLILLRRKSIERACNLNGGCAEEFNAEAFTDLLTTRKLHFVLAYGGRSMEDEHLRMVEGGEIDDALKRSNDWIPKLEEKGYVVCVRKEEKPPVAKKARRSRCSHVLTRRFCVVEEENFVLDMADQNPDEKADELRELFLSLKTAIPKTESNTSKMAFLNLFESFKNIKDITLWFCRISRECPKDEDIEEVIDCMETLSLCPLG